MFAPFLDEGAKTFSFLEEYGFKLVDSGFTWPDSVLTYENSSVRLDIEYEYRNYIWVIFTPMGGELRGERCSLHRLVEYLGYKMPENCGSAKSDEDIKPVLEFYVKLLKEVAEPLIKGELQITNEMGCTNSG